MADTNDILQSYFKERFSGSVLMEIRLLSLLLPYETSAGEYLVLPVTLTNGSVAIANFEISVWPQWIRSAISEKLQSAGGVLSESPLQILTDSKGNQSVQPVKKPASSSPVTTAEPVTGGDDPQLSPTSSFKPTAQKQGVTSKKCQTHDWHTPHNGITYCWKCQIER